MKRNVAVNAAAVHQLTVGNLDGMCHVYEA